MQKKKFTPLRQVLGACTLCLSHPLLLPWGVSPFSFFVSDTATAYHAPAKPVGKVSLVVEWLSGKVHRRRFAPYLVEGGLGHKDFLRRSWVLAILCQPEPSKPLVGGPWACEKLDIQGGRMRQAPFAAWKGALAYGEIVPEALVYTVPDSFWEVSLSLCVLTVMRGRGSANIAFHVS